MRIQCKQNAPERMMRVISKSYSFRLSFQWGVRLQRACAAHARRFESKIDAKSLRETCRSRSARRKSSSRQPARVIRGRSSSLRRPIEANRAAS